MNTIALSASFNCSDLFDLGEQIVCECSAQSIYQYFYFKIDGVFQMIILSEKVLLYNSILVLQ